MANPHPNTSGLRPPFKKGENHNPTGKKGTSWRSKLKAFCEDKGHDIELFKTLIVMGLGDTEKLGKRKPNLKAIEIIAEIVDAYGKRADARARLPTKSKLAEDYTDAKAEWMAEHMMELDAKYEREHSETVPQPDPSTDNEPTG